MMERNAWGGPSIMVWGGIGLNVKLGPVIFQNLGPGRGNGVRAARYIDTMMLGPHQAFLSIMQLSSYRSPRLLHNLVLPSAVEMQQWLSSEKMTLRHCWLRQSCRCNAH
jgi:hypothetical protein